MSVSDEYQPLNLIGIEAAPGLPPQPSRRHIFLQQRASAILRIAKAFLEHLHYVHANIEANKISELQRPHRMIHPALHHRVHGLSTPSEKSPGASFTTSGVLPSFCANSDVVKNVSTVVCRARITSTMTI